MQTRREFLVTAAEALGCWLVSAPIARRIVRLAKERNAPYLLDVPHPDRTLWATWQLDRYVLTLGEPFSAITVPQITWDWGFRRARMRSIEAGLQRVKECHRRRCISVKRMPSWILSSSR